MAIESGLNTTEIPAFFTPSDAGTGVGRLGRRVRAWGDVMRVMLALLLIGIAGCGGEDNSPGDVAAPSSPAVNPVEVENAEADGPKPKADKPPAQAVEEARR